MLTSNSMRWLVVAVSAAMLLAVVAACAGETVEVPGETVVVEKVVTETVEVPGETVVVEKEVIKTVEVPGETVTVEVVKEVQVPGETVVVEKEVVKTVEVPGETVVVTKEVAVPVEVVREVPGKNYVTDPTTGKVVSAPEYGGTLTFPYRLKYGTADPFVTGGYAGFLINGVNESLAIGDWGLDRKEFAFRNPYVPTFVFTGSLAESWETPDPLTYIFHIRQGVYWHNKAPMNGRELTADDVVYTWQRNTAQGDFTERPEQPGSAHNLPWESIEATDKYTVVMELTEPSVGALRTIINEPLHWILPPEVIEQYGDYTDWKNVVGTGPFELTDYVQDVSITFTKNPAYWGYDEKYPENRLPYVDEIRALFMSEEATRVAALRSGKVDITAKAGVGEIKSLDVIKRFQKTNPELEANFYHQRSFQSIGLNIRNAPFDDIRVRHALQMALDLETINDTYYTGLAKWESPAWSFVKGYYTPVEEWPEELKGYYRYDPEGAEALLDAAGYERGADGVRFKVDYSHRDITDLGYAEIAVGYWADIGVDVTIKIYDTATWAANSGEHNYEMTTAGMAFTNPIWSTGAYRSDNLGQRELLGGIETPELTAAYDAFFAATTVEEQMKASREFDLAVIKQHNQIWGPLQPRFQVNQPWVEGFNGEYAMGSFQYMSILARLWIDSELKKAMGR